MSDLPRVLIAAPTYGGFRHDGASRNLFLHASAGRAMTAVSETSTSLLAHAFNICLAQALDGRDHEGFTHFAMLHADVEPKPAFDESGEFAHGWVDILMSEMGASGADLISAVVPIKEPGTIQHDKEDRRTSTAIFDVENPWAPKRFIRLSDRKWLPQTFTAKTALCGEGEELCVNTGCMLFDLRRPWWDGFAFEIRDRIVRGEDGRRVAQVRPEDWEISRHVTRSGGVVAATWAVRVVHHGSHGFKNF